MQGRTDLRTELFALNQGSGERLDVLNRRPLSQIAQGLSQR